MGSFDVGSVIVGKYEVTRVLGQGGMGAVVAARHRELGKLVALKFLLPSLRDNAESCARFAREARTAIRIENPHVAHVYDVGSVDGTPFLVMEYLTGSDLARVIRARGRLPVTEAVDLLLQACEAVADAHNLGIVHRDLKPANLFLTAGPDGMPFVKVLDFGISKSTSASDVSVTASSAVTGSPLYMSPEQLASSRSVDARSDVWALGVVLYEMLTGTTPFAGSSFGEVAAAIYRGTYASIAEHGSDVPPGLEQAVSEALMRDPEARLPSVEAFAARIAPFGSEAAAASVERIRRIAARAPAPSQEDAQATIADAPPPAVVEAAATSLAQSTQQGLSQSVAPPGRGPRPRRRAKIAAAGVGALAIALLGIAVAWPRSKPTTSSASSQATAAADEAALCRSDADTGNACHECRDQNCCAQYVACQQSPDCRAFLGCTSACKSDNACRLACIQQHHDGHAIASADIACGEAHCAGPCGTRNAQPCLYCQESNCSRPIAECIADPECDTLRTCVASCGAGHDKCLQDCRNAAPTTAQVRYDAIVSCGITYCLSTCTGPRPPASERPRP